MELYVSKKPAFDTESSHLYTEIKDIMGIGIEGVRVFQRYIIQNVSQDTIQKLLDNSVLYEPPVDIPSATLEVGEGSRVFAVAPLPGQFDPKVDAVLQCIQLLSQEEKAPIVKIAKVIMLHGDMTDEMFDAIKAYVINPVESMEVDPWDAMDTESFVLPSKVARVEGFVTLSKEDLHTLLEDLGLAMDLEDIQFIQDYFKKENRNPTITELRVLDTYWSDHCRHTTFATHIEEINLPEEGMGKDKIKEALQLFQDHLSKEKPITLMNLATQAGKTLKAKGILTALDESEEINACSIRATVDVDGKDEEWLVMFKNETHNHPTEIEPFGGAATCLGGAIRDPLSGRAYVYQAMRVTGSADPRTPLKDTLPGKLSQRKITTTAAAGYSSYGNQIGLATGLVDEIYHPNYVAKRMEVGAVIGAVKADMVRRERPLPGDVIILLGGRTGRDGVGGASGSSKSHTEDSVKTGGAEVQKGNPLTERKIQRLFRKKEVTTLIKRCNDFGAGGVSVAVGELADSLLINLDKVPLKYQGLDGTELAISESQERMAVVVEKKDVEAFLSHAEEENLEATAIAEVTDDDRMVMIWQGDEIVNLSRTFLNTNGVSKKAKATIEPITQKPLTQTIIEEDLIKLAGDLNICSKKGLVERFDATVGAGTVLMPFGGRTQRTPSDTMVAKIPVLGKTNTCSLMSYGFNPYISERSPFHGAIYAVVESVAKIVATGGAFDQVYLSFQEYFGRLGQDPTKWGKPLSAVLGGYFAQMALGIAAIGGKDSMSGTFMDIDVPPTLISFAVTVDRADTIISSEWKEAGSQLIFVKAPIDGEDLPDFEQLKQNFAKVTGLIKDGKVKSSFALRRGGIAEALIKMSMGNEIGGKITKDVDLFEPQFGGFILEMDEVPEGFTAIGETTAEKTLITPHKTYSLEAVRDAYISPLMDVFPEKAKEAPEEYHGTLFTGEGITILPKGFAKPKVFMAAFPGTNCEYESGLRFQEAGAEVETFVLKNLTPSHIEASVEGFVKGIESAQMIMLPGGFSAGDEPDGSGKFIASMYRNPRIEEAVMELLQRRDGLVLGICNGFQALIKLGLLPYGEIKPLTEDTPTLTFNTIGRHISHYANTKVVSKASPWLSLTDLGEEYAIPVSHGEGRFVGDSKTVNDLIAKGQVATVYLDNPNGSSAAIEGLLSPDGRVFGKMGHSERIGAHIGKNIPGLKDQQLFKAGVNYFK